MGEKVDSSEAGNVQDKPGTSCLIRQQEAIKDW